MQDQSSVIYSDVSDNINYINLNGFKLSRNSAVGVVSTEGYVVMYWCDPSKKLRKSFNEDEVG